MDTQTTERFTKLVEGLQGTCRMLAGEDQEWLEDSNLCVAFDGEIFQCDHCGWWSDASDKSEQEGEQTCEECYNDFIEGLNE